MTESDATPRTDSRREERVAPNLDRVFIAGKPTAGYRFRKMRSGSSAPVRFHRPTVTEAKAYADTLRVKRPGDFGDRTMTVEVLAASYVERQSGPLADIALSTLKDRQSDLQRYVGEPRPIYPSLTVAENLEVGGMMARATIEEQRQRVYELLPALYETRRHRAASLSGGQQQMLGIGQALMSKPRYLCLDEPSLGLSPAMVNTVAELVSELVRGGVGAVWAEQFPEVAKAHCTTLVVLRAGVVVATGKPNAISSAQLELAYLGRNRDEGE